MWFRSKWMLLIGVAVVALLAGYGGAWLHGRSTQASVPQSLHDRIHKTIVITNEQDRFLHQIEGNFALQKSTLEDDMRLANRELADAITADKTYSPKVQAAIDHFHRSMGELQKATIDHVFEMRAILTPEQQVAFDREVRSALVTSSQSGGNGQQGH